MKGERSRTKTVKVEAQSLRIHPTAQRQILPARLRQLEKDFDLDAVGILHGVEYEINGEWAIWIVDGQHRHKLLMNLGLGEWTVEVKIHLDATDDARASELFLKLNNRATVSPFDKFENARLAGHTDAVGIVDIARRFALRINRGSRDNGLACVAILGRVYGFDGNGTVLTATLETLTEAWGHSASAMEGKLVEGLGILFKTFNGSIEKATLVRKLAKYPGGASALIGDARGLRQYRRASLARCVAFQIIDVYNNGRRTGKLDPL